jgi:hypothetical protein
MTIDNTPAKPPPMTTDLAMILVEVADERGRQDDRWGEQNHPILFDSRTREVYARQAETWKKINDQRVDKRVREGVSPDKRNGWDGILQEEVFEALGAPTTHEVREELVQTAAVVVAMIQSLDRADAARAELDAMRKATRKSVNLSAILREATP